MFNLRLILILVYILFIIFEVVGVYTIYFLLSKIIKLPKIPINVFLAIGLLIELIKLFVCFLQIVIDVFRGV